MAPPLTPTAFTTKANQRLSALTTQCYIKPGTSEDMFEFQALWDTGATNSAITKAVVQQCGLTPTGTTLNSSAHGERRVNTYVVSIGLPNKVLVEAVPVTEVILPDDGADVLIGMDVINLGDFAVTNAGGYTQFSFRIPPRKHIDFVSEINRRGRPLGPPTQ